jgi:hypothetical protein
MSEEPKKLGDKPPEVSKEKKEKNNTGRPTMYRPEYCQKLIDHMASGKSYETFGYKVGVNRSTVYKWEKKHPEFVDAKKAAFDASLDFWENAGIQGMFMGGKDNPFNSTVWVFNMKNRFNWRDKVESEVKEQKEITVVLPDERATEL